MVYEEKKKKSKKNKNKLGKLKAKTEEIKNIVDKELNEYEYTHEIDEETLDFIQNTDLCD